MAKVMIEPKDAQNVKSLVRMAVENELKILKAGVAITYRKLEGLEKRYQKKPKPGPMTFLTSFSALSPYLDLRLELSANIASITIPMKPNNSRKSL